MSDRLEFGRKVVEMEAAAVARLAEGLGAEFEAAIDRVLACTGRVVVSGIGKAGIIGEKISATFASTGTPSFFLHPAEAIHGDLGRIRREDVALLLSSSGESNEVVALIDPLRRMGTEMIALTGRPDSSLGRSADIVLNCGRPPEACPLGLAPTTSTAALLAMGDALAMTVLDQRDFGPREYARYHPGGELGRRLMTVAEIMRGEDRMTIVPPETRTRDVLIAINRTAGRPGAAMICDGRRLVGFFTDGDLARRLESGSDFLDHPIREVMVKDPVTVGADRLASEALALLRQRKIDQLPVVDEAGDAIGLIDVQDLLDARIV